MKRKLILILALLALTVTVNDGLAFDDKQDTTTKKVDKLHKSGGDICSAVEIALDKTGTALEKSANKTGKALGIAADKTSQHWQGQVRKFRAGLMINGVIQNKVIQKDKNWKNKRHWLPFGIYKFGKKFVI
jgi:hypothetical protein